MKRLKQTHPAVVKLEALWLFLDHEGITLTVTRYGELRALVKDSPHNPIIIVDIEAASDAQRQVTPTLPPQLEVKYLWDDDDSTKG